MTYVTTNEYKKHIDFCGLNLTNKPNKLPIG
jgi:DNA transposition AAA+ family ATPase